MIRSRLVVIIPCFFQLLKVRLTGVDGSHVHLLAIGCDLAELAASTQEDIEMTGWSILNEEVIALLHGSLDAKPGNGADIFCRRCPKNRYVLLQRSLVAERHQPVPTPDHFQ